MMAAARRALDTLYDAAGMLGAACLVGILLVIVAQMVCRWAGIEFRGSTAYAGYLMAAASFLTFAHALNRGAHIRVSLLLTALGDRARYVEIWCFAIGTAASTFLAYYACKAVYWSYKLHDISQGMDATPIWIPQLAMAFGAILLALAFVDHFVLLLATGRHGIKADSAEISHGE
jgi:TRAP-type C4-dicarboxylate transport system permease small subunit